MTAKRQPESCRYCRLQLRSARQTFCNSSCRNRFNRGVSIDKTYRPEPDLRVAAVREWRRLDRYPNYEVSNDGRVRRAVAGSNKAVGDLIRCRLNKRGYPAYRLMRVDGRHIDVRAHRLVAFAFLPAPLPHEDQVRHLDDDKLHCIDVNLSWGTEQQNVEDKIRNGKQWSGAKLAEAQAAGRARAAAA